MGYDLFVGQRIGRWTICRLDVSKGKHFCKCDCGNEREVSKGNLKFGGSKSCGCVGIERLRSSNPGRTHGMTTSPEWLAHKNMLDRCYNPSFVAFHRYGGRGITVCERWRGSGGFERFYADMGPRPDDSHSLDRENNDGNYEPGNCRWATAKVQNSNQSTNRLITFNGVTKTATDWAHELGGTIQALAVRLDKYGWTVEKCLTTPFKKYKGDIEFNGKRQSMAAWARETGLPLDTIRSRLRKGASVEHALTAPYQEKFAHKSNKHRS